MFKSIFLRISCLGEFSASSNGNVHFFVGYSQLSNKRPFEGRGLNERMMGDRLLLICMFLFGLLEDLEGDLINETKSITFVDEMNVLLTFLQSW